MVDFKYAEKADITYTAVQMETAALRMYYVIVIDGITWSVSWSANDGSQIFPAVTSSI